MAKSTKALFTVRRQQISNNAPARVSPLALFPAEGKRTVDQADMTVGLWKIAQHAAGQWIELFGEQTYVIAAREQTIK